MHRSLSAAIVRNAFDDRQQVDIVENVASVVGVTLRLLHTDIQQLGTIEALVLSLCMRGIFLNFMY